MKFSTGAVPSLKAVAVGKETARNTTDMAPSVTATGGVKMAETSVHLISQSEKFATLNYMYLQKFITHFILLFAEK